ncbi:MAG: PIN domain-containing protein [Acidobacteria bacterium]|nr:MAG: PIN domain-containing protein [Acidobacteriota bacterium]
MRLCASSGRRTDLAGVPIYVDSSALVKLVLPEAESTALLTLLGDQVEPISSALATVEVMRAARRASRDSEVHTRAAVVMAALHLVRVDDEILAGAANIEPETLRSLDAIHLASALSLAPEVEAMIVYDADLSEAASRAGLRVLAPA